ncbi:hypothetical protein [Actinoalloteichus sp. GBA129-24]|uniref:hypothetical protein n=1 Tax=Actinoalloteichus sp. GBA129-24 TaxID=1612551 RepID=UPI000950903D|nr:hypothetical protein [Actinoalloteichus sp. GBA129-24]APU20984.1 hypothetical protein UA75_14870 [Actinoalloteichus sp. GBA129-24]APU24233.1 hypothetical protein UA75_31350 [Actinoalloteichus sp. GBA129-24]
MPASMSRLPLIGFHNPDGTQRHPALRAELTVAAAECLTNAGEVGMGTAPSAGWLAAAQVYATLAQAAATVEAGAR